MFKPTLLKHSTGGAGLHCSGSRVWDYRAHDSELLAAGYRSKIVRFGGSEFKMISFST